MPLNPALQIDIDTAIGKYEETLRTAQTNITSQGFPERPRPVIQTAGGTQYYSGELPPDLTSLSDQELGVQLGLCSQWIEYVERKLAAARMERDVAKAEAEQTEAQLRLMYKMDGEKKRTEQERKDMMRVDSRFVQADVHLMYYEGMYSYTLAVAKAAERNWDTISRRITQRGQDLERSKRDHNIGQPTQMPTFRPRGM